MVKISIFSYEIFKINMDSKQKTFRKVKKTVTRLVSTNFFRHGLQNRDG